MKAELRVAFAMGGGVSLGAYSGAALTEALKWMIVEAAQEDALYGRVVVDVFSGSSAGSMALVLLLRALASPGSLPLPGFEDPEGRLREQFADHIDAFDEPDKKDLWDSLVAAQIAQDLQEHVWVRAPEIDLGHLLGAGSNRDLRHEAGILDRGAVEAIAGHWLRPPQSFDDLQILGKRVLFAATLGRLTPLIADARTEFSGEPRESDIDGLAADGFKELGLVDGLTSKIYRDLRVFDLDFRTTTEEPVSRPSRWMRYQAGLGVGAEGPGREQPGALEDPRTWATLGATAIASGAFPVAFAPVVLRRHSFEYGPFWPKELRGADEYLFSFVDGGTFNNEPIREAVQLASYLDANRDANRQDTDPPDENRPFSRRILFVDPLVNELKTDFRLGVFQENLLEKPNLFGWFDGYDLRRRTTLDRLLPQVGTLVLAIFNEARRIDGDEQFQLDRRAECREKLHRILGTALRLDTGGETKRQLEEFCTAILEQERQSLAFPSRALTLEQEIARVEVTGPDPLAPEVEAEPEPRPAGSEEERNLDSLLQVALDLAMGLGCCRKHTALVGIAPFHLETGRRYELPAEAIQGFAGFASLRAREHASELGRFCALESLATCKLLLQSYGKEMKDPAPPAPTPAEIRPELAEGLKAINRRLEEVISSSHLSNLVSGLDRQLLRLLSNVITSQTEGLLDSEPEATTYEVRLKVPDNTFRLRDPGGVKAQKPSIPSGETKPHLVTFVHWVEEEPEEGTSQGSEAGDGKKGKWRGPHVDGDGHLRVDRARSGHRDAMAQLLELPEEALRKEADLLPYPVFRQVLTFQAGSFPANRWELHNPLRSLDDQLFPESS